MPTLRAATFLTGRKSVFSNGERQALPQPQAPGLGMDRACKRAAARRPQIKRSSTYSTQTGNDFPADCG